jgi:hypothetical protein
VRLTDPAIADEFNNIFIAGDVDFAGGGPPRPALTSFAAGEFEG